jgi:tetratricopeptide (TPR) repeat protein
MCLARCEGECVAVVPQGTPVEDLWVEMAMYAIIHAEQAGVAYLMSPGGMESDDFAAVVRKEDLQRARRQFPALSIEHSLQAAGIALKRPATKELPFMFDNILETAQALEDEGDWARAADIFDKLPARYANNLWMMEQRAHALFHLGSRDEEAAALLGGINRSRPTVESLLLAARLCRRNDRLGEAVELLQQAEAKLQWKG